MTPMSHHMRYRDTDALSQALKHADVSAMQITRGAFLGDLFRYSVAGWAVQHIAFIDGASSCVGNAPRDTHAFVVPLREVADCRLLGQTVTSTSIGIYAPGGEHADVTRAGFEVVVLVPPKHDLIGSPRDAAPIGLPSTGSHHRQAPIEALWDASQKPGQHQRWDLRFTSIDYLYSGADRNLATTRALESA